MTQRPSSPDATHITSEEEEWLRAHQAEVIAHFGKDFAVAEKRFPHGPKLLRKFSESIDNLLKQGRAAIAVVDAAHNELCIAAGLLANEKPGLVFSRLEYEPIVTGSKKSIDFLATTEDGEQVYVDVKTLQPKRIDRFDQYQKVKENGLFPPNVNLVLSKDWLGGELWHGMYAARERMLEYAIELEEKIRDGQLAGEKSFFTLALCGEGFHWHRDGLEDFVAFYQTGSHRGDDPFSRAEAHDLTRRAMKLDRTIHRFACMNRPQFDIRPRRLNWNVQPPGLPVL